MEKSKIARILLVLLVLWFCCMPIFWRMDLSNPTAQYYDAFSMAPYAMLHLAVFYLIALLLLYFNGFSMWLVLLLALYFPAIQVINFPFLTARDVFLHAGPARFALVQGEISGTPTVESWSGSFILHTVFSAISGEDLINANYVLYFALIVTFAAFAYCIAEKLAKKGYQLAGYCTILLLTLFFSHFSDFILYSRSNLAFTLFILFIFAFTFFDGRRGFLLQVIIASAVFVVHPFQSLAIVAYVVSYSVLTRITRSRHSRVPLALFSISAFSAWFVFNAPALLDAALSRLSQPLPAVYTSSILTTLSSRQQLPWWGSVFRDFFKYSFISLLIFASVSLIPFLLQRRQVSDKKTMINASLLSLLPMAAIMFLSLVLLPDWGIWRSTVFASFPIALALLVSIDWIDAQKHKISLLRKKSLRRSVPAVFLLFIMILSAMVMVLKCEGNLYYGDLNHPSELSGLSFVFTNNLDSSITFLSWRTALYSSYYNYNSSHAIRYLWITELNAISDDSSEVLYRQNQLINQSRLIVRGMRDSFTLGLNERNANESLRENVDQGLMQPKFSSIYSNGLYIVYYQTVPP